MTADVIYSPEAEASVLGAVLLPYPTAEDREEFGRLFEELPPDAFYQERSRTVWRAMRELHRRGTGIDTVTLLDHLKKAGELDRAGGAEYLAALLDVTATAANVRYHADLLREKAQRRRVLDFARRIDREAGTAENLANLRSAWEHLWSENGTGPADALPELVCALDAPPAEPLEWEMVGLIPRGQIGAIVGEGGAGKDTLGLAIACARAGGYAPLGHPSFVAGEASPVVYVSEEDGHDLILSRVEAIVHGHNWDRRRVLGNFHYLALAGVSFDSDAWADQLIREIERVGASLVIMGPLRAMTLADENSPTEMEPVSRLLRKIAAVTGATVGIIHHVGKPREGRKKLDRMRGAKALSDACRWILWVEAHQSGILVEALKLTVGKPLDPFVVRRDIETSPKNPGSWFSATLRYQDRRKVDLGNAERFILQLLAQAPGLNSTEVRSQVMADGMRPQDASQALARLEALARIRHESGPRNSKLWYVVSDPEHQETQGCSPDPALPASHPEHAGSTEALSDPASPPLGGRGVEAIGEGVDAGTSDLFDDDPFGGDANDV